MMRRSLLAVRAVLPAAAAERHAFKPARRDKGTPDRYGRMVCPAPDSTCIADRYGDIVLHPGGGIVRTVMAIRPADPATAPRDQRGDVFCSSSPRGAASTDRYGNAVCAGNCVQARPQACVRPKAAGG